MLKLKRYLKPYIALFLGAIILLFGQALLELTLPNYMSDIVNVGLQQGGITYSAPDAIDAQSMQLMQLFMALSCPFGPCASWRTRRGFCCFSRWQGPFRRTWNRWKSY